MGESLFVCLWLLDAFCGMYLVTQNGSAYPRPALDAVVMDVLRRQYEEFGTIMPVISSAQA